MQEEDEKSILKDLADQETKGYIRFYCPEFKPEFGTYVVKTRPPHKSESWKMSMLRRTREQELREESMTAARLKCHESANEFAKCSYENALFRKLILNLIKGEGMLLGIMSGGGRIFMIRMEKLAHKLLTLK
jgi:hypothetical protein